MSFNKKEKLSNKHQKETKWDRIRKKHNNATVFNYKSEAVKRLITKDFINHQQRNIMMENVTNITQLDPVVVMDLRHKMIRECPEKLPSVTINYQQYKLDSCKRHNLDVEDHYLKNQLNCFRDSLTKQYKQIKLKKKELNESPWLIDNTAIMNSLESNKNSIQDFYETPLLALNKVNKLLTQHKECLKEKNSPCKQDKKDLDDHNALQESMDITSKAFNENDCQTKPDIYENAIENVLNITRISTIRSKTENYEQNLSVCQSINEVSVESSCIVEEHKCELVKHSCVTLNILDECEKNSLERCDNLNDCNESYDFKKPSQECNGQSSPTLSLNCGEDIDSVINEIAGDALLELQNEKREEIIDNEIIPSNTAVGNIRNSSNQEFITHIEANVENRLHAKVRRILLKYFLRWIHFTHIQKIERDFVNPREDKVRKINVFLNTIHRQKKQLKDCQQLNSNVDLSTGVTYKKTFLNNIKITKKYQNKIKIQQDIIELQRIKLERQERLIMELKLSKIADESKEARQKLKDELTHILHTGEPKNKAKAKCLQFIGNFKNEEDEKYDGLHSHGMEIPKFLRKMQERALERNIKHEQVRERRLRLEAEKEAQKFAAEEARRLEDENAKRLRLEKLKEKRLQEKMMKELKEREKQRQIENVRKAEEFCRRRLLRSVGFEGFKKLVQHKRDILKILNELRGTLYKRYCFQTWATTYYIAKSKRERKANDFYENMLKRRTLYIWFNYMKEECSKMLVAIDFCDFKITNSTFSNWLRYTQIERLINDTKMFQAASHHEWHLKWKVLDCWQRLPQILKIEKETEERRQKWRMKIWELLPDYTPNREEFNYV